MWKRLVADDVKLEFHPGPHPPASQTKDVHVTAFVLKAFHPPGKGFLLFRGPLLNSSNQKIDALSFPWKSARHLSGSGLVGWFCFKIDWFHWLQLGSIISDRFCQMDTKTTCSFLGLLVPSFGIGFNEIKRNAEAISGYSVLKVAQTRGAKVHCPVWGLM